MISSKSEACGRQGMRSLVGYCTRRIPGKTSRVLCKCSATGSEGMEPREEIPQNWR